MDIKLEDLVWFQDLKPADDGRITASALQQASGKHPAFLLKYFTIMDHQGKAVPGRFVRLDTARIPPSGATETKLTTIDIDYRFEFALDQPPPFLTFRQHFGGDDATVPASMELTIRHTGQRLGTPVMLGAEVPYSQTFDWKNGPPIPPKSLAEIRQQKDAGKRRLLGMTDQNRVYSWLQIQPFFTRHEMVIPFWKLERWVSLERSDPDFISPTEQDELPAKLTDFFRDHSPVTANGQRCLPQIRSLVFHDPGTIDFGETAQARRRHISQTRVGIIIDYVNGPVEHLVLKWDAFDKETPFIKTMLLVAGESPRHAFLRPEANELEWRGQLPAGGIRTATLPLPPLRPTLQAPFVAIACLILALPMARMFGGQGWQLFKPRPLTIVGTWILTGLLLWPVTEMNIRHPLKRPTLPTPGEVDAIAKGLHQNVIHTFQSPRPEGILGGLGKCVTAAGVTKLYDRVRSAIQVAGPSSVPTEETELTDGRMIESAVTAGRRGFSYAATWNIHSQADHWGHQHEQRQQFDTIWTVVSEGDQWRIADLQLRNRRQLKAATKIHEVKPSRIIRSDSIR